MDWHLSGATLYPAPDASAGPLCLSWKGLSQPEMAGPVRRVLVLVRSV